MNAQRRNVQMDISDQWTDGRLAKHDLVHQLSYKGGNLIPRCPAPIRKEPGIAPMVHFAGS